MLTRTQGFVRLLVLLCALALVAAACGTEEEPAADPEEPAEEPADGESEEETAEGDLIADRYDFSGAEVGVGSKEFTEQLVLGHIARIALEEAGASVDDQIGLAGTAIVREALLGGDIDLYWEYTGTAWIEFFQEEEPIGDSEEQYQAVAERDEEENSIIWSDPAPLNNTYAIATPQDAAGELGVEQLSDLQQLLEENPEEATLCVAEEFAGRDDGLPGMEEHYDIEFPEDNLVFLDEGAIYGEIGDACNFGEVFATDGRVQALDLQVLEDDQDFFPVYNAAVTIRQEVTEEYPEMLDLFSEIASGLDNDTMQQLNASVDEEGAFPDEAAQSYLSEQGFIE